LGTQYYHLRQSVEHYQSTFKEILKGRSIPVQVNKMAELPALTIWKPMNDLIVFVKDINP